MKRLLPILFLALAALAQNATVGTFSSTTASIDTATIGAAEGGSTYTEIFPATGKSDSSFTAGQADGSWDPDLNGYGSPITNTFSGTCTNIAIKGWASGGTANWKVGLYNSNSNLVASGTCSTASGTAVWMDVAVSTTVSNDTYRVMAFGADGVTRFMYDTDAGNYAVDDPTDYADAPPATLTPSHFDNYVFGVKMGVLH